MMDMQCVHTRCVCTAVYVHALRRHTLHIHHNSISIMVFLIVRREGIEGTAKPLIVYTYTHVRVDTRARACIYARIHAVHMLCMYGCVCKCATHAGYVCACMYVCTYVCMYVYMYVRVYVCMCVCVCVRARARVCVCVCVCVHRPSQGTLHPPPSTLHLHSTPYTRYTRILANVQECSPDAHLARAGELVVNLYGSWMRAFLSNPWNLFDSLVVAVSFVGIADPDIPALNLIRSIRVFRVRPSTTLNPNPSTSSTN